MFMVSENCCTVPLGMMPQYQNGPRSKHVLVGEIPVMSFATRLDLGLSLCSKTKKIKLLNGVYNS
jgi:hypothetical protein